MRLRDKAKYWSKIASIYDATYSSEWSKHEDQEVTRLVQSLSVNRKNAIVLDLGCGTGLGLYIASGCCELSEYRGCDISEKMLEIANRKAFDAGIVKRTAVSFAQSDAIEALKKTEDGTVDLVFALNCVGSYVRRTRKLLSEIIRVLKPGGAAIVSFLNRYSLKRLLSLSWFLPVAKTRSRGVASVEPDVRALLPTKDQLKRRLENLSGASHRFWYQSVFGGVWEHKAAIPLEKVVRFMAPSLGYTQNVVIVRDGSIA